MLLQLRYRDPIAWFLLQHPIQQVSGTDRYHRRDLQLSCLDVFVEALDVVGVEWRHTNEHFVKDCAHLVDISRLTHAFL